MNEQTSSNIIIKQKKINFLNKLIPYKIFGSNVQRFKKETLAISYRHQNMLKLLKCNDVQFALFLLGLVLQKFVMVTVQC